MLTASGPNLINTGLQLNTRHVITPIRSIMYLPVELQVLTCRKQKKASSPCGKLAFGSSYKLFRRQAARLELSPALLRPASLRAGCEAARVRAPHQSSSRNEC